MPCTIIVWLKTLHGCSKYRPKNRIERKCPILQVALTVICSLPVNLSTKFNKENKLKSSRKIYYLQKM